MELLNVLLKIIINFFHPLEKLKPESVLKITGKVVKRTKELKI